jgi:hypothetical protein
VLQLPARFPAGHHDVERNALTAREDTPLHVG